MRTLLWGLMLGLCLGRAVLCCGPSAPVLAAGFEGPGTTATVTRAADVLGAQDDAPCVLEGRLVEKLARRKHRYIFEDRSGQVVVEIDNKVFGQITVTPADKVRLVGHVDWNRKRPNEVEVEQLTVTGATGEQDMHETTGQRPAPPRR